MDIIVKESFAVIGMEGSTADGAGFVPRLWEKANGRFSEVEALAARDDSGHLLGIWGAMSDPERRFLPWEKDFTQGLYLAGVECRPDAQPPEGWVKWQVPGFEYLRIPVGDNAFKEGLQAVADAGYTLAGAVQDFTDPNTGMSYMLFPIRKL